MTTKNNKCCYGNKVGRQQPRTKCQYWLHNSTGTMAEPQLTMNLNKCHQLPLASYLFCNL